MKKKKLSIPKTRTGKITSSVPEPLGKSMVVLSAFIAGLQFSRKDSASVDRKIVEKKLREGFAETTGRYNGEIVLWDENELIVLFGSQITYEDDAERSINAALEMFGRVDEVIEDTGFEISMDCGIDSGHISLMKNGSKKSRRCVLEGEVVERAKALMRNAENEILVSRNICESTNYLFDFDTIETRVGPELRDFDAIYKVVGMKEIPGKKREYINLYSPLVGRKEEFGVMKAALDDVVKAKGAAILIRGEAGIGKTRLIEEFRKVAGDNVDWLCGRCPSYGRGFPFWVFLEQIRSYLGIQDSDIVLGCDDAVEMKGAGIFSEKTDEYLPYLCVFLSLKLLEHLQEKVKYLDPQSLRLQEFISVKTLLRDIAREKAIVLYFEDMHWIDPESMELLLYLLEELRYEPILFLFETRPEKESPLYRNRGSLKRLFRNRYIELDLTALIRENTESLIGNLLNTRGKVVKEVSPKIIEKSEGNPFYIFEIVRSFIEKGILERERSTWKLAREIAEFEIPDSIEAVIRSRIEQLPSDIQDVLHAASVIGKSFDFRILSAISKDGKLMRKLVVLETRDFLNIGDVSAARADTEHSFRHILIRDVAYGSMSKSKRRDIHAKVAMHIEELFKERIEEYFEVLAHHYENARHYDKAYNYYLKAGQRAKGFYRNSIATKCFTKAIDIQNSEFPKRERAKLAELYEGIGDIQDMDAEYEEAIRNYNKALSSYEGDEEKAQIMRKKGHIFRLQGKYDQATAIYERVIEMLKNLRTSSVLSETLINYAFMLSEVRHDYQKAQQMVEKALDQLDREKESKIYARGLTTLGNILLLRGKHNQVLENHKEALDIYEKLNDKKGIVVAFNYIGNAYNDMGNLGTALRYYEKALKTSEEIGYKSGIGALSGNIGYTYMKKSDFDTALEFCERYLAICTEIGDKAGIGKASGNIGTIYFEKGELDTALTYNKRYLSIVEDLSDTLGIGFASNSIGDVYYEKGEPGTAMWYYKRFLEISKEIGYKSGIGSASCNIGLVHLLKGDLDTAWDLFKEYRVISEQIGDRLGIAISNKNIGDVCLERGEYDCARESYEKALSIFDAAGDKRGVGIAYLCMGDCSIENHQFDEAMEYLKQAEKLLLDIDCKMYLSNIYSLIAEVHAEKGRFKRAIATADKALSLAQEIGAKEKEIIGLRIMGKVMAHDQCDKAISFLKQSLAIAKKQKMRLNEGKCYFDIAVVLKKCKREAEAQEYLEMGKAIFSSSGAKRWLDKIQKFS